MKRVSFKVAKAIKEAGYPQEYNDCICSWDMPYYTENGDKFIPRVANKDRFCVCPTYFEAADWIWREKKIYIEIASYINHAEIAIYNENMNVILDSRVRYNSLEDAIIDGVEYLIDNDLIK